MNVQSPVLHLLLVNFKPGVGDGEGRALVDEMGRLHSIDGVLHVGTARAAGDDSTHARALFVCLRDAAALEVYGSHPLHIDYLRRRLLPVAQDFASIDVAVHEPPPATYEAASCHCANFRPDTYDWQIRSLFQSSAPSGAADGWYVSGGVAVNERQRYRAAAVMFLPAVEERRAMNGYASARRMLDEAWGAIASEEVNVTGPAHPLARQDRPEDNT
jgi:hypothetical protein